MPRCTLLALFALPNLAPARWVLNWGDEFDGSVLNTSLWTAFGPGTPCGAKPPLWNQMCAICAPAACPAPPRASNTPSRRRRPFPRRELYTPENAFVDSGALVLRTRLQNATWNGISFNVTSGRVDTALKANITFGRVEVSAQLQNDAASGIHTAHWLLGYGCWPQTAEVDIMECQSPHGEYRVGGGAAAWQKVTSNYHYGAGCGKESPHSTGASSWPPAPIPGLNFSSGFNVFAVEWNATDLVYFVNDVRVNHVRVERDARVGGAHGGAQLAHVPDSLPGVYGQAAAGQPAAVGVARGAAGRLRARVRLGAVRRRR